MCGQKIQTSQRRLWIWSQSIHTSTGIGFIRPKLNKTHVEVAQQAVGCEQREKLTVKMEMQPNFRHWCGYETFSVWLIECYCLMYVGYWYFYLHLSLFHRKWKEKDLPGRKHLQSGDYFPTRTGASSWGWIFRTPAMFHNHFVHGHVSWPPHSQLKSIKVFTDHCILWISSSKDFKDLFMTVIISLKWSQ